MEPTRLKTTNRMAGDIPVSEQHGMLVSQWRFESLRELLEFILFRRLTLIIKGEKMPTMIITGYQNFEFDNPEEEEKDA